VKKFVREIREREKFVREIREEKFVRPARFQDEARYFEMRSW